MSSCLDVSVDHPISVLPRWTRDRAFETHNDTDPQKTRTRKPDFHARESLVRQALGIIRKDLCYEGRQDQSQSCAATHAMQCVGDDDAWVHASCRCGSFRPPCEFKRSPGPNAYKGRSIAKGPLAAPVSYPSWRRRSREVPAQCLLSSHKRLMSPYQTVLTITSCRSVGATH